MITHTLHTIITIAIAYPLPMCTISVIEAVFPLRAELALAFICTHSFSIPEQNTSIYHNNIMMGKQDSGES